MNYFLREAHFKSTSEVCNKYSGRDLNITY